MNQATISRFEQPVTNERDVSWEFKHNGVNVLLNHFGDSLCGYSVDVTLGFDYSNRRCLETSDYADELNTFDTDSFAEEQWFKDLVISTVEDMLPAYNAWLAAEERDGLSPRVVQPVFMNDVHQAEGEFFIRNPGTEALIADWRTNVETVVFGSEPITHLYE